MVWAGLREQRRWWKARISWRLRAPSIVGTPGLFLLETGIIFWFVTDPRFFQSPIWYYPALSGVVTALALALAALAFLCWRQLKDRGS
jgi:hypothetical protein